MGCRLPPPRPPLLPSDRAQERRLGVNPDYEGDAGDVGSTPAPAAAAAPLAAFAAPPAALTADETKFLGGDEAHTHLVRGLDYALLERVRREKEQKGVAAPVARAPFPAPAPRAPKAQAPAAAPASPPSTSSSLAAAVLAHAASLPAAPLSATTTTTNRISTFLPKRTAYLYALDGVAVAGPPTTVARAAADCPPPRPTATAGIEPALLDRLARILAYVTGGKGGRKLKKREKEELLREVETAAGGGGGARAGPAPAPLIARTAAPRAEHEASPPPPPAVADEDDDIFGDAGREYDVDAAAAPSAAVPGPSIPVPAAATGGYFGAGPAAGAPGGDGVAAYGEGPPDTAPPPAAAPKPSRIRPPDDDDDDAYAELYPAAMAGFGRQAYSDDEEEEPGAVADALAAKDAARKEKGGAKAAAAKAAAKAKKEKAREEARTDAELAKIRQVIEKKRPDKAGDLDEAFDGAKKETARAKRRRLGLG